MEVSPLFECLTPTAAWFIDGDYYRDHKHQDGGEVILYALGAPLSLDFGSMYSPRQGYAQWHSVVQSCGTNPKYEEYKTTKDGGYARTSFDLGGQSGTRWTRAVSLVMLKDDLPVIAIQDGFNNDQDRACHLNLMVEGPGQATPVGENATRIAVTGQTWKLHPTKGIDAELFVVSDKPLQIGWDQWQHQWHPSVEQSEFQQANGRGFEEKQQQLKLKGKGLFRTFIVPFFKGQRPPDLALKVEGDRVTLTGGGKKATFKSDGSFTR